MTAATLFGVTLAPLFAALAHVESGRGMNVLIVILLFIILFTKD